MDPQVLAEMEKLARAKAIIRKLESSDGQNMAHAMLTAGPNKGQTAGGAYGIVPNSLIDFAKQSKNRKLPVDPEILEAMQLPHDQVTKRLNEDRDFDEKAAEMAMKLVLMKAGGDEERAAYRWRTGHNQPREKVIEAAPKHPYVQAYRRERENYKPQDRQVAVEKPTPPEEQDSGQTFVGKIKTLLGM